MWRWLFAGELGRKGRLSMLGAAALVALSFLGPLWSLSLDAPQYPEGLKVHVYAHKLGGRVDIVNALNHYIGMRPIREEDFAEFDYLPRIFGALAGLMLLGAVLGRRWVAGLIVVVTPSLLLLLYDLRRWLYQFGHDLDPRAPIRIQPFTPPVVGWNRLANFVTFSYFNWGTLLILAAIGLVIFALVVTRPARAPRPVPEGVKV